MIPIVKVQTDDGVFILDRLEISFRRFQYEVLFFMNGREYTCYGSE